MGCMEEKQPKKEMERGGGSAQRETGRCGFTEATDGARGISGSRKAMGFTLKMSIALLARPLTKMLTQR